MQQHFLSNLLVSLKNYLLAAFKSLLLSINSSNYPYLSSSAYNIYKTNYCIINLYIIKITQNQINLDIFKKKKIKELTIKLHKII